MENNLIKKLLYKQQPKAKFIRIKSGHAYYGAFVELEDKTLQQVMFDVPISDLGDAELWRNEEAKLLIRYLAIEERSSIELPPAQVSDTTKADSNSKAKYKIQPQ